MDATQEEWRAVVDFEGCYEVSSHGRVRSVPRYVNSRYCQRLVPGRIIAAHAKAYGHLAVGLSRGGKSHKRHVHRVVLEAFVGPCPEGMECCHNDGDSSNNRLDNLRWDTSSSNKADLIKHGARRPRNPTHCGRGHRRIRGERQCKKCVTMVMKARYYGQPIPPITHCSYGHLRTPESTFIRSDGKVRCKPCLARREAEAAAA